MDSKILKNFNEIKSCRVCKSKNLISILSLGEQYVSNFIEDNYNETLKSPLELVLCDTKDGGCGLVQLKHTVHRNVLYKKYWFRSGLNETMRAVLSDITSKCEKLVELQPQDIVLDIGSNDGTLLRTYKSKAKLVGFEPATNLLHEAKIGTNKIINDFFSYNKFKLNFGEQKAKIITSVAMFYDLDDPNSFVSDIAKCLEKDGIWIIQMAYLPTMLQLNAFDNIGHEHLEYYSLRPLRILIEKHGLEIFDVEINEVYGGSIRTFIKHKKNNNFKISSSVKKLEDDEETLGLYEKKVYHEFVKRVQEIKLKLVEFINQENNNNKIVYVYGASTKGNTLLQFCGLNNQQIKKAADRDSIKWGKKTIGSEIPIISEEQARRERPDYFLILPWHLIDFFKDREKDYLKRGGKFIVPIPEFRIISNES